MRPRRRLQPPQVATPSTADTSERTDAPRLAIETDRLSGSISLLGGRIDDLKLKDYREELAEDSPIVTFLSPKGQPHAYYALYGWAPGSGLDLDTVPGPNTVWSVEGNETLTATRPGDPEMGQRRGPHLPPHHLGRRRLPL